MEAAMSRYPEVLVVMGSSSDADTVKLTEDILLDFDVPYELRIISAHRTPNEAMQLAKDAKSRGFKVVICAAGMAAHLAGVFAANTTLPIIGLPLSGGLLGGVDSLFSTVQMPSGFPVATVAVDGAKNAALLAISILALSNEDLSNKLETYRQKIREDVLKKDDEIGKIN
jgi:5-(carboxyamino)imidazole ribonucleotide mutase